MRISVYFRSKPPGWDRRGEILIRFGPPDHRERTWAHIGYGDQRSPGVIWHYYSHGFLVSFFDEFLNAAAIPLAGEIASRRRRIAPTAADDSLLGRDYKL
jgi:hypothetical protein